MNAVATGAGTGSAEKEGRVWSWMGPVSGVLFVALFAVGFALAPPTHAGVGANDPAAEIAKWLEDRRGNAALASPFFGLGTFFFIWFLSYLREHMRTVRSGAAWLVSTFWAAGLLFGATMLMQGLIQVAQSAISDYGADVAAAKALFALGVESLALTLPPLAAMAAAAALLTLRFDVLPRWLGWLSLAVFVGAFVAPLVPLFAVWVLAVSAVLALDHRRTRGEPVLGAQS